MSSVGERLTYFTLSYFYVKHLPLIHLLNLCRLHNFERAATARFTVHLLKTLDSGSELERAGYMQGGDERVSRNLIVGGEINFEIKR